MSMSVAEKGKIRGNKVVIDDDIQEHFFAKTGGIVMDDLLQKYNDYMRLKNCRAEYLLRNGMIIGFVYQEENFIHLIGLHKLIDIQLIQLFNCFRRIVVRTETRYQLRKR